MTETGAIRGLWCAALTPVSDGGEIDSARFGTHVRELLAKGVTGVVAFGTTGEGPSFSVAERAAGLEALLDTGIPRERLAAATGCAAFTDAVALARHALGCGVQRCLVLPPFYWKELADEAVFRYYAALIETIGNEQLRLYLYHYPQLSGVFIRPEVVARLADAFPGVVAGVKDSGGDFGHTAGLLQHLPGLSILSGHEPDLPRQLRYGGAGTVCGLANLFPALVAALLQTNPAPDDEGRVQAFLDIVTPYPFVPSFKALRAAHTGDPKWLAVRPPLLPLPEFDQAVLLDRLRAAGFDMIHGQSGESR